MQCYFSTGSDAPVNAGDEPLGNPNNKASGGMGRVNGVVVQVGGAELPRFRRLRHPSPCGAKGLSASRGEPRRMMDDEASGESEGAVDGFVGTRLLATASGQRRSPPSPASQGEQRSPSVLLPNRAVGSRDCEH